MLPPLCNFLTEGELWDVNFQKAEARNRKNVSNVVVPVNFEQQELLDDGLLINRKLTMASDTTIKSPKLKKVAINRYSHDRSRPFADPNKASADKCVSPLEFHSTYSIHSLSLKSIQVQNTQMSNFIFYSESSLVEWKACLNSLSERHSSAGDLDSRLHGGISADFCAI